MKLCAMCKHFNLDGGHVYSEYTADPASVNCGKGHWYLSLEADADFRNAIRKAETCKDYDDAE